MLTRRGWIAAAGAARLAGANGRIGVGVIGVGGRGQSTFMPKMSPLLIRLGFPLAALLAWRCLPGAAARPVSRDGYVLAAGEGEVLHRPNGKVVVKVDPRTGSPRLAMGTQDLIAGARIAVHKHEQADEILYIQKGSATATLGDRRAQVAPGTTIYIPRGVWHGVESSGQEIQLLWIVSPPGLEAFFREIGAPPGAPIKQLTPSQMADIGRKHGTTLKPQ